MLECTQIPGQWTAWSGFPTHLLGIWETWLWPPMLLFIIYLFDQRTYIITRLGTTKTLSWKENKTHFIEKKAGLVVGGNVSRAREGGARRAAIQWWRAEGEEPGTRNWLGGGERGRYSTSTSTWKRGRWALVPKRENEGENKYMVAQRRGVNRSLGKIPLHSVLENLAWK